MQDSPLLSTLPWAICIVFKASRRRGGGDVDREGKRMAATERENDLVSDLLCLGPAQPAPALILPRYPRSLLTDGDLGSDLYLTAWSSASISSSSSDTISVVLCLPAIPMWAWIVTAA